MNKLYFVACLFLAYASVNGQVLISTDTNRTTPHPNVSLELDGNSQGLILPRVSKKSNLPKFDSSQPDLYADDAELEGMIMYINETGNINSYKGDNWLVDDYKIITSKRQSRFIGQINDNQSVTCAVLICGRSVNLSFSYPVDNVESYNPLGIVVEDIRINSLNTDKKSKFIIKEAGVYEISVNLPTYLASVIGLTDAGTYRLLAYRKNGNSYEEIPLGDGVPNFPGVLGIGGGSQLGFHITSTIALNVDDYVIAMIHSPGATVSVGAELRSTSPGLFNPREIIFTKLD